MQLPCLNLLLELPLLCGPSPLLMTGLWPGLYSLQAQSIHTLLALQEDIVKAMGLTGQLLMGQAVMVKSAEVNLLTVNLLHVGMVS